MISVTQDFFVVTAVENYFPRDEDVIGNLVLEFDRKGKLLNKKRTKTPKPEFKPYKWYSFMDSLPKEKNGLERPIEGGTLIIPEHSHKHEGSRM